MDTGGFIDLVGIRSGEGADGRATLELDATDQHLNQAGTVHGGVLATLVDSAMGLAVRTATGDDDVPATSQLTIAYLRPGKPGHLVAHAQVRKQGEHLLVCDAEVEQDDQTLVHAVATFALVSH